jgi:4-hydroxybenzoate polyprenyltransferase
MLLAQPNRRPSWQTLLVLGRVSNLPTVWSNCLAGWLLGGGGRWETLGALVAGATALYVGGMFLNDAFDVEFDQVHRRERPIPSGQITVVAVWAWGFGWLALGLVLLAPLGRTPALLAFALVAGIVLYDALHKLVAFAPLLMAACRSLLYLLAGAAAERGVGGLVLWSSLALGSYITGLSYFAVHESAKRGLPRWPVLLLFAPVALAVAVNAGSYRLRALLLSLLLGAWIVRSLDHAFRQIGPNVGAAIAGLLAGIALVDLLAVAGGETVGIGLAFLGCFVAALLLQRLVPAT